MRLMSLVLCGLGCLLSTAGFTQEPQQCIQNPARELPCPHVLIKKTDPIVQQQANIQTSTVCICVSDFAPLLEANDNTELQEQSRAWLAPWQLSETQFIRLMRY
ncbi:hypothetical protein [Alteromonas flava]|uniref:hypothetical protein n=1 Tax=Alteromonas flava TaxID=2048003 RepID=UPI000F602116|nr:hypothetical protein [Alteromonas flava]